jgi:thiol:disulfide interchange protein
MDRLNDAAEPLSFRFMTWIAFALLVVPFAAQAQLPPKRENAISIALVPEAQQVPAGSTVTMAFTMRPKPGWHGYWQNPGDAGTEAKVEWQLPQGAEAGPIRYPVPDRLTIAGLMNYVFERDYALLTELRIPANLPPATKLPIRAKLDYLACTDEICVPETALVATEIEVGQVASGADNRALIERYRQALPRPLAGEGRFEIVGGRFRLAVPLPSTMRASDPYFYPLTLGAIEYAAAQNVSRNGDMLIVETAAGADAAGLQNIEGVLEVGDNLGLSLSARRGDVPAAGEPIAVRSGGDGDRGGPSAIWFALLGAFVGGLLLNIMPCVFPILSLKALSLAKVGGDERAARREALAYAAGAVLMCLALGGALLGVRAGGAAVGWAFQLQDPRVILFLLLLVTAIAFNLAGLFELPALGVGQRLAGKNGAGGSFWTGALAAFVATPCTGPFMGAALGAALILPPAAALAVFAGLGLGLASPFLLLGFVPLLRRRLPKPGPWMERFRRILSVPMLLTALGLAWILGRQAGVDGMALGLGSAMMLAIGLWWAGRRHGKPRAWLPLVPATVLALSAILLVPTDAPAVARTQTGLPSESFSEARLAALRAEGRPVFVYFTADWCLTCKVNETTVLNRAEVARSFADRNMAVLVGDWTGGDAEIGRFLESHGRSGIPLYLYYAPGRPPEILPQLLTVGRLAGLD